MSIRLLSPQLRQLIAAGQVVVRPASIVKECVENSLDACATDIVVEVEGGGVDLIRIRDNGLGMSEDDLPLAVTPHATSKIQKEDDLLAIQSFGFRGEALASTAAVSRFALQSKQAAMPHAFEVLVEGGAELKLRPASHPDGSCVTVRDLFYNVPARRKFLKSPATEFKHIQRVLEHMSLAACSVAFALHHNGKCIWRMPAAHTDEEKQARLAQVMGEAFAKEAVWFAADGDAVHLSGWLGRPTYARGQGDQQWFYLNQRVVRDKALTHAVRQAYHGLMMPGRHPAAVLFLCCDPEAVDVNVHPTKDEVRFRDQRTVYGSLLKRLREALAGMTSAGHRAVRLDVPERAAPVMPGASSGSGAYAQAQPGLASRHVDPPNGGSPQEAPRPSAASLLPEVRVPAAVLRQASERQHVHEARVQQALALADATTEALPVTVVQDAPSMPSEQPEATPSHPLGFALAQLHGIYILAQNEEGLLIVDMHAAHERILLEKMKAQYRLQKPVAQRLLVPEVVTLSASALLEWEEAYQQVLQPLGFEIDVCGENRLRVRAVPSLLASVPVEALIQDVLAECAVHGISTHSTLR